MHDTSGHGPTSEHASIRRQQRSAADLACQFIVHLMRDYAPLSIKQCRLLVMQIEADPTDTLYTIRAWNSYFYLDEDEQAGWRYRRWADGDRKIKLWKFIESDV